MIQTEISRKDSALVLGTRFGRVLLVVVALVLFASSTAIAAGRPLDLFALGAPSFTNFGVQDGLPETVAVAVQTDRDGFVWAGSPQGLARYDGHRWQSIEDPALTGFVSNMLLDHAGTLWASFRDLGIAHYDGVRWQLENRSTGLPTQHIRRIAETIGADGKAELWALTIDAGLLRHQDGKWIAAEEALHLPVKPLISIARTHSIGGHERIWISTYNEGLWYLEKGVWQRLHQPGFDPAQVEHLLVTQHDGHEELWISTFGLGLARITDNGIKVWSVASGDLPSDELYNMSRTSLPNGDRVIWISSRAGLVRIYDDHAQVFDRRHGLPSDVVRGLSVWRAPSGAEVIWLATEAGVSRTAVRSNQWQTASLMGARGTGVFGVLVDSDGQGGERLWLASTKDGIGLFQNGIWRQFNEKNGALPGSDARMLKQVPNSNGELELWAGLHFGLLLQIHEDGPRFESIEVPWEKRQGQAVLDILARQINGHYERWFATRQSGIYRWSDGAWKEFRAATAVGQWRVVKLLEQIDGSGRSWLWASTNQGLARFDGEQWILLGIDAGLPDVELSGMSNIPDAQGRPVLWIGTEHSGMMRIDVADPLRPMVLPASDLPAAPDATTYSATRDSKGRIYICSNSGVQLLTPTANGYDTRAYTRRDGMLHEECNTNAQFIDAHDRFWTGTLGGLTVFDPDSGIHDHFAKPLKLTHINVDGASISVDHVRLPYGAHDIGIEFALLSWQRESESRFRTQLLDYEQQPSPWNAQNFRNFNSLPPGHYVLRIEGRDYAGNISMPIELPIEIVPSLWQSWWAIALFALTLLLLGLGIVQWRTRSLNIQRRKLERQIIDRTAELHRANARLTELSYKDALTGLANRRRLLETLEVGNDGEKSHHRNIAFILIDVDHFKDYNDRFGHLAGDEALRRIAGAMRACVAATALVARYGGEEFACVLADAELAQARAIAERIRAAVADCEVSIPGSAMSGRLTVSAGVAYRQLKSAADAQALLHDADIALYQAKREGRNCVRG